MTPHRILILDMPKPFSGELPYSLPPESIWDSKGGYEHFNERKLPDWIYNIETHLLRYLAQPPGRAKGTKLVFTSPDTTHLNSHGL